MHFAVSSDMVFLHLIFKRLLSYSYMVAEKLHIGRYKKYFQNNLSVLSKCIVYWVCALLNVDAVFIAGENMYKRINLLVSEHFKA